MRWELIAVLLVMAVLATVVLVPIMLAVLWSRFGRLERDLKQLRGELTGLKLSAPPPVPSRPEPAQQPDEASAEPPGEPEDLVEAVEAVGPPAEPIPPVIKRLETPASAATVHPTPSETREHAGFEELLAGKWMAWVGAVAVVIGTGFFLRYAVELGLIGPTGRVAIGILSGMACFTLGAYCMLRDYRIVSQALVGTSLGILYFSLFAAWDWYGLIPQGVAFAGMIAVTAAAVAFSASFNAQPTAVLGLLGGLLTPLMLSTGEDSRWVLFPYLLVLDAGVLGVACFRKWQTLQSLALAGTALLWLGWFAEHYEPTKLADVLVLLTLFFLLFALLGIWHNVLRRVPAVPADFFVILATPVLYFLALYGVTEADYARLHGLLAVGLGGAYLGFGLFALSRHPQGRGIVLALAGVALSFLTLAIPLQLTGHWIAIAWAAESLLLLQLGLRFREPRLRWAGFGLLAVVQLILVYYAIGTLDRPETFQTRFIRAEGPPLAEPHWSDVFNGRSFSFLASAGVLAVLAWEYRRRRLDELVTGWALAGVPLTLLAMFLLESFSLGHRADWIAPTRLGLYAIWTSAAAVALVALATAWGPRWLDRIGLAVFGLLGLLVLVATGVTLSEWRGEWRQIASAAPDWTIWAWPLINPRGLGLMAALAAGGAGCWLALRDGGPPSPAAGTESGASPDSTPSTAALLGFFAHFAAVALLTAETYAQGVMLDWGTATALAVTLVWTLYAVGIMLAGIFYRSAGLRILALLQFVLTTAKVFLYDVWYLDEVIRTFAFVALGLALLLVSFLYRRFRDRIRAWITPVAAALLLVLLPAPSSPADPPSEGRAGKLLRSLEHRWPIAPPEAEESPQNLIRIDLPADLYGRAKVDLGDVRVLTSGEDGAEPFEVPFVRFQPTDIDRVVTRPATMLNLSQVDGTTEFLLELAGDEPVNEIRVVIDRERRNYDRPVRVYGANRTDPEAWNLLLEDGYLFDFSRGEQRLTVDRLRLPPSRFHVYRVVIDNRGQPPLRVVEAHSFERREVRVPRRRYPAELLTLEHSEDGRRTHLVFDLLYDRLPTLGLEVEIATEGNYYRPATLAVTDHPDRRQWRTVGGGYLYRIERGNRLETGHRLEYGETAGRYLRLSIDNGDDLPLEVVSARGVGIDRALLVERRHLLEPSRTAALYAGNAAVRTPQYDLERTIGNVDPLTLAAATVAPREANPPATERDEEPAPLWSEQYAPLIWVLTIAGVVLLGLAAFLLLRQAARTAPGK